MNLLQYMKNSQKQRPDKTVQYADLGFRMMGIVIAFVVLGIWLDSKFENLSPLFTATLSIFSVFAAMYIAIKGLSNKK